MLAKLVGVTLGLVFLFLFGGVPTVRGAEVPKPPDWDAAAFARMDGGGRIAWMRGAIAWRENRLANLRYQLTETIQDVETKTGIVKKTWSEKAYEVRRLGQAYWISGTVDFGGHDGPRRYRSGWDGVVYRTFCEAGKIRPAAGSVAPEEQLLLSTIRFNALLGLRVPGIGRVDHGVSRQLPFGLTEWMDHFNARKDNSLVVGLNEDAGDDCIEIKVQCYKYESYVIKVDPRRQFMPTSLLYIYDDGHVKRSTSHRAIESKLVDGMSVPVRVVSSTQRFDDPTLEAEWVYVVSHFTLGDVKRDELKVNFGGGALIVDGAAMVAYRLDAQKHPTPELLVDSKTSKGIGPSQDELDEAIAVNPIENDLSAEAVKARRVKVKAFAERIEARRHAEDFLWKKPPPPFPAEAVWHNSKALTWERVKGKVVILHFCADGCAPCKNDYPTLNALDKSASKTIVVIGVHINATDAAKTKRWIDANKLSYPICVDVPSDQPNVSGRFFAACGVSGIPHAVLVGADGLVVDRGALQDIYDQAINLASEKGK